MWSSEERKLQQQERKNKIKLNKGELKKCTSQLSAMPGIEFFFLTLKYILSTLCEPKTWNFKKKKLLSSMRCMFLSHICIMFSSTCVCQREPEETHPYMHGKSFWYKEKQQQIKSTTQQLYKQCCWW